MFFPKWVRFAIYSKLIREELLSLRENWGGINLLRFFRLLLCFRIFNILYNSIFNNILQERPTKVR